MVTELGFIYYLSNPQTGEIFYVGATQVSIKNRLRTHYQHLKEVEKGKRKTNKRYEYLKNLRPLKAEIHLLEILTNIDIDKREKFYINLFRKANPKLTNMTDGGRGQHTSKYYTEKEMEKVSQKISKANKGKPKPEGFAENLSKMRKGLGNPATKELSKWIVCLKEEIPIRMFKYGFEINNFMSKPSAYGNIYRNLDSVKSTHYGYRWKTFENCRKEIQDIVQSNYENS